MSSYAPGTPEAEMRASDARFYGKPLGGAQSPVNPFQPIGSTGFGGGIGGGKSAVDGIGQINQGTSTVENAVNVAQKANNASNEALVGGGGNPMGGGMGLSGPIAVQQRAGPLQMKKGGKVKAYAKGGMISSKPKASSASSRGDGIAQRGKTKGRFV